MSAFQFVDGVEDSPSSAVGPEGVAVVTRGTSAAVTSSPKCGEVRALGEPGRDIASPSPRLQRFLSKVQVDDNGCWLWTASMRSHGYGNYWDAGRNTRAHRWAYENFVAPIPDGMVIDHLCRVRHCVNPAHLEAVTGRENRQRGVVHTWEGVKFVKPGYCANGHPRADVPGDGYRECRACARERYQRAQAAKAEASQPRERSVKSLCGDKKVWTVDRSCGCNRCEQRR